MLRFGLSADQVQDLERNLRRQIRDFNRNRLNLPNAPNPPMANLAPPVFVSDPFEGNINPGDQSGLKLYTLATAARSDDSKLVISQENVKLVLNAFRQDSNSFGWGLLINQISNAAGTNYKILSDFENAPLP